MTVNLNSLKNLTDKFRFKKGLAPWNKGKKGLQISWLKGTKGLVRPNLGNFKKNHPSWTKGLPKEKHPAFGKPKSVETRRKISITKLREKNPNWKGGIYPHHKAIRHSLEYKLWREAVFKRDNYTCIWCGERGKFLNADHIKPFALFPELRFAIDNGRTLCIDCHKTTDTYGGKSKNNSATKDISD